MKPSTPLPTGRQRRPRSAFTLPELMIAVSLFATVALLTTRTVHTAFQITSGAEAGHASRVQWEQATRLLRQDVWAARVVSRTAQNAATIELADGRLISWTIDEAGTLQRTLSRGGSVIESSRWSALAKSLQFELAGADLVVVATDGGRPTERLRLPLAATLLQEGRP